MKRSIILLFTVIYGVVHSQNPGIEWDQDVADTVQKKLEELLVNPPTDEFDLWGKYLLHF